ncbi:MAG: stage III sporulation protein AB [Coprococcus sp.]
MIGCGGTGLAIGRSCRKRIEQMRQMRQSLLMLHGEIRYTGAELPEAISETAGRCGKPFSDFYETLSEQMRQMTGQTLKILWQECAVQYLKQTCLTKEDQTDISGSGQSDGYLDSQMQLSRTGGMYGIAGRQDDMP